MTCIVFPQINKRRVLNPHVKHFVQHTGAHQAWLQENPIGSFCISFKLITHTDNIHVHVHV